MPARDNKSLASQVGNSGVNLVETASFSDPAHGSFHRACTMAGEAGLRVSEAKHGSRAARG